MSSCNKRKTKEEAGSNLFWEAVAKFWVHTWTTLENYVCNYISHLWGTIMLLERYRTILPLQSNIFTLSLICFESSWISYKWEHKICTLLCLFFYSTMFLFTRSMLILSLCKIPLWKKIIFSPLTWGWKFGLFLFAVRKKLLRTFLHMSLHFSWVYTKKWNPWMLE